MTDIRTNLDDRLAQIEERLLAMIDVVALRTEAVTSALLEADVEKADTLIRGDDEVDLVSLELEELCITTLLLEQPVASDLRLIVSALHMNTDIERSADLTTNIAKAIGRLQGSNPDDRVRDLVLQMSEQAQMLFLRSGDALRERDLELAKSIDELDDVLDELHVRFIQTVIQDASHGGLIPQQTLQLALIGRFYERIGDHAENLGERIAYIIEGTHPEAQAAERAKARRETAPPADEPVTSRGLAVIDSVAEERRIDAIRRDFVANVSHELKTPVGAMVLLSETLVEEDDPEVRARLTAHLGREAQRVEHIIDDLLELTRLEEPGKAKTPLEVDHLVGQSVDTVRGLAEQMLVEVAVVGVPSGLRIVGDARQLQRALVNLVDNAVRYSEPNSQVTVSVGEVADGVEIAVQDEGIGIPRADLERIFERFYRVDRARSRETGGTGLGLAIVRHAVDNHGGRVVVESKPGEGSTFTMVLPLESEGDD